MQKFYLIFTTIAIAIILMGPPVFADAIQPTDTDGNGYYNISTLDHLRWVSENESCWTWNFELDNDIDAGDTKNWDNGLGFSPIGDSVNNFTGIFHGNGYAVDSLYVYRPDQSYIGLFGYTGGAQINNIRVSNCNVTGTNRVGGLAGENASSTITNSYVSCSVTGINQVGGLVGWNASSGIMNSSSTGSVTGGNNVGGLVGLNYASSSITNSYSTGSVIAGSGVGGLVGWNTGSSITNSYSTSSITTKPNCYDAGGLVGVNYASSITNSYSTGSIAAGSNVGGLAGSNLSYGTIDSCFWDTETSGIDSSAGGTPKTTAQMKTKSTFTDAGWDFETIWAIDPATNAGYPILTDVTVSVTENISPTTNLTCSPNPCSTSSKIAYSVNNAGFVNIAVYDMLGNEVAMLVNNYQTSGAYEVIFNAEALSAGLYFVSINSAGMMETGKIIVAR